MVHATIGNSVSVWSRFAICHPLNLCAQTQQDSSNCCHYHPNSVQWAVDMDHGDSIRRIYDRAQFFEKHTGPTRKHMDEKSIRVDRIDSVARGDDALVYSMSTQISLYI